MASSLAAYPNPGRDRIMLTLPEGFDHLALEVLDGQGRLVHASLLNANEPFVEVDVHGMADGLYLARVLFEGLPAAECKFTIVR